METWILLLYLSFGNGQPPQEIAVRDLQTCQRAIAEARRANPQASGFCLKGANR